MSEPRTAGHVLSRLNLVLCALVLVLLVCVLVVLVGGAKVLPGSTPAARVEARYTQVEQAARREIAAFLKVDYTNMDPLIAAVLDGATGTFHTQYNASKVNLKAAAQTAKSVSNGTIRQVGVTDLGASTATVFVAADAVVKNTSTVKVAATKACPTAGAVCRYYRLKLGMTETAQGWKISGLDFVS